MLKDFQMIFIKDGKIGIKNYNNEVLLENSELKYLIPLVDSNNSILLRNMQKKIEEVQNV